MTVKAAIVVVFDVVKVVVWFGLVVVVVVVVLRFEFHSGRVGEDGDVCGCVCLSLCCFSVGRRMR